MRELNLQGSTAEMLHPQILPDGSVAMIEVGIRERLQHGCNCGCGWEGDLRLEVYMGPDGRFHVWRLGGDGQYHHIVRSRPGIELDHRLISFLVSVDAQRGYDVGADIINHNLRREQEIDKQHTAQNEENADRLYSALKRDLDNSKVLF